MTPPFRTRECAIRREAHDQQLQAAAMVSKRGAGGHAIKAAIKKIQGRDVKWHGRTAPLLRNVGKGNFAGLRDCSVLHAAL